MPETLTDLHSLIFHPDHIPKMIAAWLICVVIGMISGPLRHSVYPFVWQVFELLLGNLGVKLDNTKRPRADLMFRGFLVTAFALLIAAGLGKLYEAYLPQNIYLGILPILGISILITAGTPWFSMLQLYFSMEKKQPSTAAFKAIEQSSRFSLQNADEYGVTRTAITLSARSFDKGLVAPMVWYLIGGWPVAIIYSALCALSVFYGRNGTHKGFAAVPMALERLMGYVPNILAAVFLNLAAFITPTAKLGKSLTAWIGYNGRASYEQGGFALSSLAWALNVTLGGPGQDIKGQTVKAPWVGPKGASAKIDHHHLRRAIYINVIAQLLFIAALLGAYVWSGILS